MPLRSKGDAVLSWVVWIAAALVIAKAVWVAIGYWLLPISGINSPKQTVPKGLYYRTKFAPKDAPITPKAPKPKPIVPPKAPEPIKSLKLLAIYSDSAKAVVTVLYQNKSIVLSKGEKAGCFMLENAQSNYAEFTCNGKRYRVELEGIKKDTSAISQVLPNVSESAKQKVAKPEGKIIDAGDRKVIDRSLVQYYTKNLKEIGRNVGIVEKRKGNQLEGFEVSFIRSDSDFAKLGLRRGDVIKSVNGQPINSYKAAIEAYRSATTNDTVTLVVQRGEEEMELEYEIN